MIEYKNRATGVNDVSVGSPSRILIVLLISLGITTLPRSSILLTIPVAFIYIKSSVKFLFVFEKSVKAIGGIIKYNLYFVNYAFFCSGDFLLTKSEIFTFPLLHRAYFYVKI